MVHTGFSCGSGVVFCCKQKTAYEWRISDWSSDVCSSDLEDGKEAERRMTTVTLTPFDLSKAVPMGKRLFRKQILKKGTIKYKGKEVDFDDAMLAELAENFDQGADRKSTRLNSSH